MNQNIFSSDATFDGLLIALGTELSTWVPVTPTEQLLYGIAGLILQNSTALKNYFTEETCDLQIRAIRNSILQVIGFFIDRYDNNLAETLFNLKINTVRAIILSIQNQIFEITWQKTSEDCKECDFIFLFRDAIETINQGQISDWAVIIAYQFANPIYLDNLPQYNAVQNAIQAYGLFLGDVFFNFCRKDLDKDLKEKFKAYEKAQKELEKTLKRKGQFHPESDPFFALFEPTLEQADKQISKDLKKAKKDCCDCKKNC